MGGFLMSLFSKYVDDATMRDWESEAVNNHADTRLSMSNSEVPS